MLRDEMRKRYAQIALSGNNNSESGSCCMPDDCCGDGESSSSNSISAAESSTVISTTTPIQIAETIGYSRKGLQLIPQESTLSVGCGSPLNFANIRAGEMVIDLGSGADIDVFLSANRIGANWKVIGIDMTDDMLEKASENSRAHGYHYSNMEFRKGNIEKEILANDGTADLVISSPIINLTTDKIAAFKEVHRVLKRGERTVISDLVTDVEVAPILVM